VGAERGPGELARQAMRAVEGKRRAAWLAGFADDALLEDPVGHVPSRRGADELAGFWDVAIAGMESVRFEVRRMHEGPSEALALVDVTARAPGGATAVYDAALHYVFDSHGAIVSLRAFWDLPEVVAQLAGAG
jgi:steroid delta-isomerase